METPMIIWRFNDGKLGHENQTNGLVAALSNTREIQVFEVPIIGLPKLLLCWLVRKTPAAFPQQKPDIIVGAGRKTHLPMVIAKSLCGGKTVVLMRPSLPTNWFDFVVVPQHDNVPTNENVLETLGVLNAVEFVEGKGPHQGLMLVGGESSHFIWNEELVISQIEEVISENTSTRWMLTTSRRTPDSFLKRLRKQLNCTNLSVVPFEETDQQWMANHFLNSGQIWVTPDSVSMVYESISSGAATRVFSLEPIRDRESRVRKGLEALINHGCVTTFDQWKCNASQEPPHRFNESERIATIILERLH